MNGQLEHIKYELCGGNPHDSNDKSLGYFWYWGLIEATDYTCYLVFWYDYYRNLERITASFAGRSPTSEEWKEMTKGVRYAAEMTARGAF